MSRSSGFSTCARPRATRRRTWSTVFSSPLAYFSSSTSIEMGCSSSSSCALSSFIGVSLPQFSSESSVGSLAARFLCFIEPKFSHIGEPLNCLLNDQRESFYVNLQQFRFLREAARHKFSLTEAARALHTSGPGNPSNQRTEADCPCR